MLTEFCSDEMKLQIYPAFHTLTQYVGAPKVPNETACVCINFCQWPLYLRSNTELCLFPINVNTFGWQKQWEIFNQMTNFTLNYRHKWTFLWNRGLIRSHTFVYRNLFTKTYVKFMVWIILNYSDKNIYKIPKFYYFFVNSCTQKYGTKSIQGLTEMSLFVSALM